MKDRYLLSSATVLCLLAGSPAGAQTVPGASDDSTPQQHSPTAPPLAATGDASQTPSNSQPLSGNTDDIVVTARKRSETAQTIPISIQAVSQQALTQTGTTNLADLPRIAPGVTLARAPNANETGLTIRGLGTGPGVPSFDASVSLFVDGVYAPRSREFTAALFDIERIEVISGTQAALLGKNTSLGAVNLITRKPGTRFEADVRASYEFAYGSPTLTGGIDLPVTDRLQVRISGLIDKIGGYVHNDVTGTNGQRSRDVAVRGVAVWKPLDQLHLTAVAQHFQGSNRGASVEQIQSDGTPEFLAAVAGYPGIIETRLDRHTQNSVVRTGGDQRERMSVDKYSLTADIDLGEHTLTSVSAYSRYAEHATSDLDYEPGDFGVQLIEEHGHQFTQELRLLSPSGRRFEYLVGGLYLDGTLDNTNTYITAYPFEPVPGQPLAGSERTDFYQRTRDYSIFGQGTFRIVDDLKATTGIRFTHEQKTVNLGRAVLIPGFFSNFVFPPYAPTSVKRKENNFDYSGGLQYSFNPHALVYVSYGKGTKAGGFASSVTQLDRTEYGSETARTAEFGVKLSDAARKWLLNVSFFSTNVDGFQVVSFTGTEFVITNADLRSRGIELQSYYHPTDWLRLFVNNVFADAKDRHTGAPIPLAPRWNGSSGFNIDVALPTVEQDLRFKLDGNVDWRSKRYYHQDPATSPPGLRFVTLNLSAAIAKDDGRYELRLIGRNLNNANSLAFAFPTPFIPAGNQTGTSERGRTIALQISSRF